MVKTEDIIKTCEKINNNNSNISVKVGISSTNDSIVIYDTEYYDLLFGYKVLGNVAIDKNSDNSLLKVEDKITSKMATITGMTICTAVQK